MDIRSYLEESINVKTTILKNSSIINCINNISQEIIKAYQRGNKVLIAGNGGSAADAQHFACELVSKFNFERKGLSAIALSTDTSILTSIGNDYGFENIFSRQIEAQGREGDIFVAISTSGNSKNILKSLEIAKEIGLVTIGLTGEKDSLMDGLCDL